MELTLLAEAELDRVKPLWLAYRAGRLSGSDVAAPLVGAEASWARRRQLYETVLADGGAVVAAHDGEADHGYAAWRPVRMPWPATFDTAPCLADFTSLVVSEGRADVADRLATRMEEMAAALWLRNGIASVNSADTRLISFYRRRGFTPVWTILARFDASVPTTQDGGSFAISEVPAHEVDELRSLCDALHDHHRRVAGHLAPFVAHERSWAVFRPYFLASAERGLALRAGAGSAPSGMVTATLLEDAPLVTDVWAVRGDMVEIEVLAVAEAARGRGLGKALMRAIDVRLKEAGIRNQIVGAFAPNHGAVKLYLDLGFKSAVLQLAKFDAGR
ncbi:MAG: GNAT family N-acetyltransferase [Hyphomicrobium sp.]|uniref:GNAT family N-acetyltransferase n=1 Tax=Hyphomicrobium sp. TaxID=82 RepID=UPI003D0B9CC4